jgi:hypothetical protein
MGNEARCRVEIGSESSDGNVLLETDELICRGTLRAKIPFREMKDVAADGGVLRFRWKDRARREISRGCRSCATRSRRQVRCGSSGPKAERRLPKAK